MATSNEYGKLAEKCFRLVREAKTEKDRLACLDLAQKWLEASSHNFGSNLDGCSGCSGFSAGIDYTPNIVAGTKVPKIVRGE